MLKVELSGTVLDEVKYNIIQCRICFNKGMEKISINFLKPELLLQLLSIAIFFGKIHPVLIKNLIFFPGFFEKKKKKKHTKPKQISFQSSSPRELQNQACQVPKFPINTFHTYKFFIKKTIFLADGLISFCSKHCQKFLAKV